MSSTSESGSMDESTYCGWRPNRDGWAFLVLMLRAFPRQWGSYSPYPSQRNHLAQPIGPMA